MTNDIDCQQCVSRTSSTSSLPSLLPGQTGSSASIAHRSVTTNKWRMTSPFPAVVPDSPNGRPFRVIHEPPGEDGGDDDDEAQNVDPVQSRHSTGQYDACAALRLSQATPLPWPTSRVVWALPGKTVLPITPLGSAPTGHPDTALPVFNFLPPAAMCWPTTFFPAQRYNSQPSPNQTSPVPHAQCVVSTSSSAFYQTSHPVCLSPNSRSPNSATQAHHSSFPEACAEEEDRSVDSSDRCSEESVGEFDQDRFTPPLSERNALPTHTPRDVTSPTREDSDADELSSQPGSESLMLPSNYSIPLQEMREFALHFKERRTKLGYTQADVGLELRGVYGMEFSQATICRFESLSLSYENLCRWKIKLEKWLALAETRGPHWSNNSSSLCSVRRSKQRRRTMIGPAEKKALVKFFEKKARPRREEVNGLASHLNLRPKVIKTWLGNHRQKVRRLHAFQQLDSTSEQPEGN